MVVTRKRRAHAPMPDVLREVLADAKQKAKGKHVIMYAGQADEDDNEGVRYGL